jgi:hypothetical protein
MSHRAPERTWLVRALGSDVSVVLAVLIAVVTVASFREVALGKEEFAAADEAATRAAWPEAIWHARSAAESYVPGSPWPELALRKLDAIGREAAVRGDRSTALLAFGAVRTAALTTRFPGHSNALWCSLADDALVRLAASAPDVAHSDTWALAMRADLQESSLPSLGALTTISVSALAIVLGIVAFSRRGGFS